jgi:AcrR family transcriptional regulator
VATSSRATVDEPRNAGPTTAGPTAPATRDAILTAAQRRYARFGPRKTTMAEVAREAGCSRATLYGHFPGKQALYAGLLERETDAFLAEIETAAGSSERAQPKLRQVVEAAARIYAHDSALRVALVGDEELTWEQVADPVVRVYESRVIELLAGVLRQGIEEGAFRDIDPDPVAYLMYQLGRVLVTREVAGRGEYPLAQILSVMDDLVANGIARRPRPAPARGRKR